MNGAVVLQCNEYVFTIEYVFIALRGIPPKISFPYC
jgi:hypothetical protein